GTPPGPVHLLPLGQARLALGVDDRFEGVGAVAGPDLAYLGHRGGLVAGRRVAVARRVGVDLLGRAVEEDQVDPRAGLAILVGAEDVVGAAGGAGDLGVELLVGPLPVAELLR